MAGGPTIAHILLDGLRERLRAERGCTAIELAVRAAVEPGRLAAPLVEAWLGADSDRVFAFGLARFLDGLEALDAHASGAR